MPVWSIIARKVPFGISLLKCLGIVKLRLSFARYKDKWLPFWRHFINPAFNNIRSTSITFNAGNLGTRFFYFNNR